MRRLDTKYLYKGKCRAMGVFDAGTIAGARARSVPHDGPRAGRRVRDRRRQEGGDLVQALEPRRGRALAAHVQAADRRQVSGPKSFYAAAATSPFTFNVGYADDRTSPTYSAGRLPLRDPRVDPRPADERHRPYEWKGFLKAERPPARRRPARRAARQLEQQAGARVRVVRHRVDYGSIQRVQMLNANLATQPVARPRVGDSRDERGGDAGPPRAGTRARRPRRRAAAAARRRARGPADARPAAARGGRRAAAAWTATSTARSTPARRRRSWTPSTEGRRRRACRRSSARSSTARDARRARRTAPGSGFTGGRINYVDKDLRALLGAQFKSPFKHAVLRRGRPGRVPGVAVAGVRRRRQRARRGAGHRRPVGVAVGRERRAHQVRRRAC